jgi:TRAP-type mannitol/chloroaromatic compound transport system permease large subunit
VVLGSIKGGLGLAVVVVCTVFAATTGIIGASVVAMGLLATPALLRKNYQKEMTSGIICAAGTLGILIPPSIMMVVYGGLTGLKETTVGNLFAGAIFPGMLLAGLYFALYFGPLQHQPRNWGPDFQGRGRHVHGRPKVGHDPEIARASPGTDPGGDGYHPGRRGHAHRGGRHGRQRCVAILALANRKLTWDRSFRDSCRATLKTTSMVMMLFIGGKFFSSVFLSMGGGDVVADVLIGSG